MAFLEKKAIWCNYRFTFEQKGIFYSIGFNFVVIYTMHIRYIIYFIRYLINCIKNVDFPFL